MIPPTAIRITIQIKVISCITRKPHREDEAPAPKANTICDRFNFQVATLRAIAASLVWREWLSAAIAFFEDFVEVGAGIDVVERPARVLGVEVADLLRAPLLREAPAKNGDSRTGGPGRTRIDFLLRAPITQNWGHPDLLHQGNQPPLSTFAVVDVRLGLLD